MLMTSKRVVVASHVSNQEYGVENTAQDPKVEDWTLHRRGLRPPVFTSQEEVRVDNSNVATPFDFKKKFFAPQFLEQIVPFFHKQVCEPSIVGMHCTPSKNP